MLVHLWTTWSSIKISKEAKRKTAPWRRAYIVEFEMSKTERGLEDSGRSKVGELCEEVAGVSTQPLECKLWVSHLSSLGTASPCQELPVQTQWAEGRSMINTRILLSSASLMGMDQYTEHRAPETRWRTVSPKSDSWL